MEGNVQYLNVNYLSKQLLCLIRQTACNTNTIAYVTTNGIMPK